MEIELGIRKERRWGGIRCLNSLQGESSFLVRRGKKEMGRMSLPLLKAKEGSMRDGKKILLYL